MAKQYIDNDLLLQSRTMKWHKNAHILIEIWVFTRLLYLICFISAALIEFSVLWFHIYLHYKLSYWRLLSQSVHLAAGKKILYMTFLSSMFPLQMSFKFIFFLNQLHLFIWKNTPYIMLLTLVFSERFELK